MLLPDTPITDQGPSLQLKVWGTCPFFRKLILTISWYLGIARDAPNDPVEELLFQTCLLGRMEPCVLMDSHCWSSKCKAEDVMCLYVWCCFPVMQMLQVMQAKEIISVHLRIHFVLYFGVVCR